jgi:hypothetical protein
MIASDHCSNCQDSLGRSALITSALQNFLALSRSAGNSCLSRKFSNHSKTNKKPARSRSVKPRNSARSRLQHQRVFAASMTLQKRNHGHRVNLKSVHPIIFPSFQISSVTRSYSTTRRHISLDPPQKTAPDKLPDIRTPPEKLLVESGNYSHRYLNVGTGYHRSGCHE